MEQHQLIGAALVVVGLTDLPLGFLLRKKNPAMLPLMLGSAALLIGLGSAFLLRVFG